MREKFCPVCGLSMKYVGRIENKTIYECKDNECKQTLEVLDDINSKEKENK